MSQKLLNFIMKSKLFKASSNNGFLNKDQYFIFNSYI